MTLRFSKGNHKLSSKILTWNLPPGWTCPNAGECIGYCYAQKATKRWKHVRVSRYHNFELSKKDTFVSMVNDYLKRYKGKIVRIHGSGDFYSIEYVEKWLQIIKDNPDIIFYAFTKSFDLFSLDHLPSNFVLMQSTGSTIDHKIDWSHNTARVVDDIKDVMGDEYTCPYHDKDNFTKCGECCTYCMTPGEIKHVALKRH